MRVARGWREGPEMDERAAKESEMIWKGVRREGGKERKCMCSRQLKIACNSVVNEKDFFVFLYFYKLPKSCSAFHKKSSHFIHYLDSLLNLICDSTICLKLSR